MVSAFAYGLGSSPGQEHCPVFLDKTLTGSLTVPLSTQVELTLGGNPLDGLAASHPGRSRNWQPTWQPSQAAILKSHCKSLEIQMCAVKSKEPCQAKTL